MFRDLGLKSPPKKLAELTGNDSGISPEDLEALTAEIEAAQASAGRVSRTVRTFGSSRVYDVSGGPAPGEAPGTLLLWFVDTSAGEEERAKLSLRLAPDRSRAELPDPCHRSCAVPDVVPRRPT